MNTVRWKVEEAHIWKVHRIENIWDPDAPLQRLRWEQDGVSYEIVAFGEGLTLDELVTITESFQ